MARPLTYYLTFPFFAGIDEGRHVQGQRDHAKIYAGRRDPAVDGAFPEVVF